MNRQTWIKYLENLKEIGFEEMTVAELSNILAGQPPNMEVYIDADGVSMYCNRVGVENPGSRAPYLRIFASTKPDTKETKETYEEELARQEERARALAGVIRRIE